MPPAGLLSGSYATPGRRSHGRIGTVPRTGTGSEWGGFNAGGLTIAATASTPFCEEARAPCFGTATTRMKGGKSVTALFLALAFVHPAKSPAHLHPTLGGGEWISG